MGWIVHFVRVPTVSPFRPGSTGAADPARPVPPDRTRDRRPARPPGSWPAWVCRERSLALCRTGAALTACGTEARRRSRPRCAARVRRAQRAHGADRPRACRVALVGGRGGAARRRPGPRRPAGRVPPECRRPRDLRGLRHRGGRALGAPRRALRRVPAGPRGAWGRPAAGDVDPDDGARAFAALEAEPWLVDAPILGGFALIGVGVVALLARAPWPHALRAVPGGLDTTVLVGITVLSVRQLRIRPEQ
jgi:hypothetical protein